MKQKSWWPVYRADNRLVWNFFWNSYNSMLAEPMLKISTRSPSFNFKPQSNKTLKSIKVTTSRNVTTCVYRNQYKAFNVIVSLHCLSPKTIGALESGNFSVTSLRLLDRLISVKFCVNVRTFAHAGKPCSGTKFPRNKTVDFHECTPFLKIFIKKYSWGLVLAT